MITIVDYGVGNLRSIYNMLKRVNVSSKITGKPQDIEKSEKLILPGVGAFDYAMHQINNKNLLDSLNFIALEKQIPVLGICLGMQLLMQKSEEGKEIGLGWVQGEVKKLPHINNIKIPHMGWNIVKKTNESPLINDFKEKEIRFYFVHSYFVELENKDEIILQTEHGVNFCSALQKDNIFGTQFHPEKSHKFGMQLLKNFSKV